MAPTFNNMIAYKGKTSGGEDVSGKLRANKGWLSFDVWKFEKGQTRPLVSVNLSIGALARVKGFIENIIASTGEVKHSFEQWAYNRDLRQEDYKSTFIIGRDSKDICYIECHSADHKEPIRFNMIDDVRIKQGGQVPGLPDSTKSGIQAFLLAINTTLPMAIMLSDEPYNSNDNKATGSNSGAPSNSVVDDIPF